MAWAVMSLCLITSTFFVRGGRDFILSSWIRAGEPWIIAADTAASTEQKIALRSRMKLPMHGFKPLLIDMRVNLRCRNIRVAEHFLDNAQIGAVP